MSILPVLYLHGFASSPGSRKVQTYREIWEAQGREVRVPDLNENDFEHLTLSRMLALVGRESHALNRPYVLMGSSLGGYTAALAASGGDSHLRGLVLMAPAFDFARQFRRSLGQETFERWKNMGRLPMMHYAYDEEKMLHFGFTEDAPSHAAYPAVGQLPTLLMHGLKDDVVPVELSERFVELNPSVEAHYLDSGHDLIDRLPKMVDLVNDFLAHLDAREG